MSIIVADLITLVTLAILPVGQEVIGRRLAQKIAPQPLSFARRLLVSSVCAAPFVAWWVFFSLQPWHYQAMVFLVLFAFPMLALYDVVHVLIMRRRLRGRAALYETPPAITSGEE